MCGWKRKMKCCVLLLARISRVSELNGRWFKSTFRRV